MKPLSEKASAKGSATNDRTWS